jgi:hypothetical protein
METDCGKVSWEDGGGTQESTESITRLGNESMKQLEHYPSLLLGALQEAIALVAGVKEGQCS